MNVGYFIAGSLHYLPTILPLVRTTGGKILTFNKGTFQYPGIDVGNVEVLYYKNYQSLRDSLKELSIDILVHPSFSIQFFKMISGVKHVQIFHGTSDKPFNYHKSLKRYDLIIVPGPRMKDEILERGLAEPDRISVIGYPKIDAFLSSDFDIFAFKKEIGLDFDKKTVLFSPTWNDPDRYSSFPKFITPVMKNLSMFNVIVKPHPNILKYRPWQILKAYLMRRGNCLIIPKSYSILPFMAVSDVLLTDISSVSHEFLPFDKPMIFLSPRTKETIPEIHRWIWRCGDVVEDKKNLLREIKGNLNNPVKYKRERDNVFKQVFLDFDGKSNLRFKTALIELLRV